MTENLSLFGDEVTPIREQKWDVFISYARHDARIARLLALAVERRGLKTWYDAKLKAGEPLKTISEALFSSGAVIVLLSRSSMSSDWIRREVRTALSSLPADRVFPVAVGELDLESLPTWLVNRRWLHLPDAQNVDALVDQLMPRLQASVGYRGNMPDTAEALGDFPPRLPLVGVDRYMRQLVALETGVTWVVGAAGVGKSALCREYAHQVRNNYELIFWITTRNVTSKAIQNRLARLHSDDDGRPCLIIVDDIDSFPESLELDLLAQLSYLESRSRIVISSRRLTHKNDARSTVLVGALPQSAMNELLSVYKTDLSNAQSSVLDKLGQASGGSPLVLKMMLEALKTAPDTGLITSDTNDIRAIAADALTVILGRLEAGERRRLNVLSFCPWLLPNILSNERWRAKGDDELVGKLVDWGLFAEEADGTIAGHPIVLDFIRANSPKQALGDAISFVVSRLPNPSDSSARDLLPSVAELSEITHLIDSTPEALGYLADLLIWQASVWRQSGHYDRAELICVRAASLAEESGQLLPRLRAMSLQSAVAFDRGRIGEASLIEKRTVDLAVSHLGAEHPVTVASIANFATTLRAQGDTPGAITLLRRGLAALPREHPDSESMRVNLAICLREAGLVQEALDVVGDGVIYAKGADARQKLSQVHAALLADLGRPEEAAAVLTESLYHSENRGAEVDVLTTRANLAIVTAQLGRVDEAIALQADVLVRSEIILGREHPQTLAARNSLAHLRASAGDHSGSRELLEEVATARTRLLGPTHPDTLQSRLSVARAVQYDDAAKALEIYTALLADVVRTIGPDHAMSLTIREELAQQRYAVGDLKGSVQAYRELLADMKRVLPEGHPMVKRVSSVFTPEF